MRWESCYNKGPFSLTNQQKRPYISGDLSSVFKNFLNTGKQKRKILQKNRDESGIEGTKKTEKSEGRSFLRSHIYNKEVKR